MVGSYTGSLDFLQFHPIYCECHRLTKVEKKKIGSVAYMLQFL